MASIAVRTPYESFFAANSKDDQRLLLGSGLEFVKKELDNMGVHFAYQLSGRKKEAISKLGISLHPVPFLSHSHPFSKILENNMILNVLPEVMGNGKWVFSSIKKNKIDTIIKKRGVQSSNVNFVNKVICAKDFSRYDFEPKIHEIRVNMASQDFIFPKSYMKALHGNKIFIHDEVHHWNLNDMIYFLDNVSPKMLVFTVVYPPELLKGIKQPQNPEFYDFDLDCAGEKLFFFPDGCKSEFYEQPARLDWLFEASYIDTGAMTYTVKLIKSTYAHHMFQIVPGEYVTESRRFFNDFDTIDLSILHENRFHYYDYVPIKKSAVQKVYNYLLCLKKPDVESGITKVRQLFDDEHDTRVVMFFSKFCKDVINKHKNKWDAYGFSWMEDAKNEFIKMFPAPIGRAFERWKMNNLFEFLFNLKTLNITIETRTVRKGYVCKFIDYILSCDLHCSDPARLMESKWTGAEPHKFQKWSTRVMFRHHCDEIIDGARRRVSVLIFLAEKRREKKNSFVGNGRCIGCSIPGPFEPPEWILDEIRSRKEKEREEAEKKKREEESRTVVKVGMECVGWYVKINLSTMVMPEMSNEHEEIGRESGCSEDKKEKPPAVEIEENAASTGVCQDGHRSEENLGHSSIESAMGEGRRGLPEIPSESVVDSTVHGTNGDPIGLVDPGSRSRLGIKELEESVDYEFECKDYSKTFKMINVKADGNCFFRSLRVCLGKDEDSFMETKEKLALAVRERLNCIESITESILMDGEFTSDASVKAIINAVGLELRISSAGVLNEFICIKPGLNRDLFQSLIIVHMHLQNEHFSPVIESESSSPEFSSGMIRNVDPTLMQEVVFRKFKMVKVHEEKFALLSSNMGVELPVERSKVKGNLMDVESICDAYKIDNFNSCLIHISKESLEVPVNCDKVNFGEEGCSCFLNVKGSSMVKAVWDNGDEFKINVIEGDLITIPAGRQCGVKWSICEQSDGHIGCIFRNIMITRSGSPIVNVREVISRMSNSCMIKAVAECERKSMYEVMCALIRADEEFWMEWCKKDLGGSVDDLIKAAGDLKFSFELEMEEEVKIYNAGGPTFQMRLMNEHFSASTIDKVGKVMTELEYRSAKHSLTNDFRSKVEGFLRVIEHNNVIKFKADKEYAAKLISSFKNRTTGISLSDMYSNGHSIFEEAIQRISEGIKGKEKKRVPAGWDEVDLNCIIGFGGSGKSRCIQNFLKGSKKKKFLVISPRAKLAEDWRGKVECSERKIRTFETALRSNLSEVEMLIIDEMTLFPPGYLDLLIYMMGPWAQKVKVVCIFDVYQARYHSEVDVNIIGEMHDVDRIVKDAEIKYLLQSYRLCSTFFKKFMPNVMVKGDNEEAFKVRVYDCHMKMQIVEKQEGREIDVLLVASRMEKDALKGSLEVMTFGESQGLTFDRVAVILSEDSEKQDEYRWMVALTRARLSICFLVIYRGGMSSFMQNCGNKLINCFLRGEECTERRLKLMSPAKVTNFVKSTRGGKADEVDREERLEGDPFLKPLIFLGQRVNVEEPELIEPEIVEPKGKTHICIAQENFAQSVNFDNLRAKEMREFRFKEMETNQFSDSYEKVGPNSKIHTTGPMRFEAIYPRHHANDDLTFWMAVHKRLRFSTEAKERAKLKGAMSIGQMMYYNLKEKMKFNFSPDPELFERCINDFEVKKLSKSKATIANHAIRSDSDWPLNEIFLFMKSQLCTKFEKQYCDAKAGQTLACFQHMILIKFAPFCRYMEAMIRQQLPPEIYIHSNKNFNDLNEWVIKHYRGEMCVESDYEAFDASQDEYIVAFETAMMEDMGLPNWFINDYIDLKCNLGCKLGHFAIMRFTGEFCTFLFNTMANMAFTMCRYEWSPGQPIAFAGDDMCALSNLEVSNRFEKVFEKLSLTAKVVRTDVPMFCGWRLSKYGIVKEPELVYNRFMVAKERGNVDECLENYAIEVSYAYSLGERLYEILKSERQIEYHQSVVRFIVQRLGKLKTKVKDLFSDQQDE